MVGFGINLLIEHPTATTSFRHGLPEPRRHGRFEVLYIPVFWIPEFPAGMTGWFNEMDIVLDDLNEVLTA